MMAEVSVDYGDFDGDDLNEEFESLEAEIAFLRAERDALQAQLAQAMEWQPLSIDTNYIEFNGIIRRWLNGDFPDSHTLCRHVAKPAEEEI